MSATMEKTLFNMKFTSKQLLRESKKCEKKQKDEEKKVVAAIKKGDRELMKVYASNAIREKNNAVNFIRLSSRIDAVASRVETAIRMNAITKQLGAVTKGMDSVLGTMDVGKITNMMDRFESQFDNLDVRSSYMEDAIASSTSTSIPENEVDELINMVSEAHAEELGDALDKVGLGKGAIGTKHGQSESAQNSQRVAEAVGGPKDDSHNNNNNNNDQSGGGNNNSGGGGGSTSSLASRLAALRK
jgi:charged multivesicular body protein 1